MRSRGTGLRSAACFTLTSLILLAPAASTALGAAQVRFVHAVPGAGSGTLSIDGTRVGSAGFGRAGSAAEVPEGDAELALRVGDRAQPVASQSANLRDGRRYTVVALRRDGDVELRVYPNGRATAGKARLRVVHAAAELGAVDALVDREPIATRLERAEATAYQAFEPGSHSLAISRPGGDGGPLASRPGLELVAGTSSTALIVGSAGEPTRFLVIADGAVAPTDPPATGRGGLAGGDFPWLLVLVAALAAGTLGGVAYGLATGALEPLRLLHSGRPRRRRRRAG